MADGHESSKDPGAGGRDKGKGPANRKGKERVGQYSLDGLATAWDNIPSIRKRMREDHRFLVHYDNKLKREVYKTSVEKTTANVRANRLALSPLLSLMHHNNMLLPNIDRLIEQVSSLYSTSMVTISGDTAYNEAWSLRELLTLLKGEGARCCRPEKPRKIKDRSSKCVPQCYATR